MRARLRRVAAAVRAALSRVRFRRKLVVTYLIILIIPMTALGLFTYHTTASLLDNQLEEVLRFNTSQLASSLSNRLEKNNEFIRFTSYSPYLMEDFDGKPVNWYQLSRKINTYFEPVAWYNMSINNDFDEFMIYYEHLGQPIGYFIAPGGPVKDTEWYQLAKGTGSTNWLFTDGELYAVRRLYNAFDDVFLGVIYVRFDTDRMLSAVVANQLAGYRLAITGEDGGLLYSSFKEKTAPAPPDGGVGPVELEGGSYYVSSQEVPGHGWTLHTYFPTDAYSGWRRQLFYIPTIIIGVSLVVFLGLIFLFTATLTKRLETLSDSVAKVTGKWGEDLPPQRLNDEIGLLADSFGSLVNQVYKSELMQKQEEFNALQAQVNPHFLYNSLSFIRWKALEADNQEISHVATALSTFYRTSLNRGRAHTTVADEVNNVRAYIDIQLFMHEGSFDVSYEVDEEALQHRTLNVILQPLVENAIAHGLDEQPGARGRLAVRIRKEDARLRMEVEDNGVGMAEETCRLIFTSPEKGYGIKNVDRRIRLYYGDQYGVTIHSAPGEGTLATILIPAV